MNEEVDELHNAIGRINSVNNASVLDATSSKEVAENPVLGALLIHMMSSFHFF